MASKGFKPDKPAKVSGGYASTFNGAVSQANSAGDSKESSLHPPADQAWAKRNNQVGWENEATQSDNPN